MRSLLQACETASPGNAEVVIPSMPVLLPKEDVPSLVASASNFYDDEEDSVSRAFKLGSHSSSQSSPSEVGDGSM